MTLNLPPELERAIEARVRSGRFASRESALLACVEVLDDRRGRRLQEVARLRERLDEEGPQAVAEEVEQLIRGMVGSYALTGAGVVRQGMRRLLDEEDGLEEPRRNAPGLEHVYRGEVGDRDEALTRLREKRKLPLLGIPPEFERAILDRLQPGEYDSAGDVLRGLLEALEAREQGVTRFRYTGEILDDEDRGELLAGHEVVARLEERVREGRYGSIEEVFRAGFTTLDKMDKAYLDYLRREIRLGRAIDRGEVITGEEAMRRLRERLPAW